MGFKGLRKKKKRAQDKEKDQEKKQRVRENLGGQIAEFSMKAEDQVLKSKGGTAGNGEETRIEAMRIC